MANQSSKQMEQAIYAIVECLADEHGFDADEAMDLAAEQVEALMALMKPAKVEKSAKTENLSEKEDEAVLKLRKNIALWTAKLEKGDYKDKSAHEAKIATEQKKLDKILGAAAPPPKKEKEVAPKKEKEETPKKEKEAPREKRVKKMSAVLAGQLAKALEEVGISELTDALKKEFSNVFMEAMTDEHYKGQGLNDHMRDFAKTKATKPSGGGGNGPHPDDDSTLLSLKELQKIKNLASSSGEDGGPKFWDAESGKNVCGPDAVEDEDILSATLGTVTYGVGEKSGRVYLEVDGRDVFQGFRGVGKFKALVVEDN